MKAPFKYWLMFGILAALLACAVYFDRSSDRSVGYIMLIAGVAAQIYTSHRYDAGRYLAHGGRIVTKADEPRKFERSMRFEQIIVAVYLIAGAIVVGFAR